MVLKLTKRRSRIDSQSEEFVTAARVVRRLAVLLEAGIAPSAAWGYLADQDEAAARRVVSDKSSSLTQSLQQMGGLWNEVATAWSVAVTVGAPLAASLRALAEALRGGKECWDDVRLAVAEPQSSAKLMAWLPLIGLLMGAAMGFDTLGVLFTTPPGWVCLVSGVSLMLIARSWSRKLLLKAAPGAEIPGLEHELYAIALSAGVSLSRAEHVIADARGPASGNPADYANLSKTLTLSRSAGVPAVELLRAEAQEIRHNTKTAARLRASALGAKMLLPLACCTLPAFFLLSVAPMLISIFTSASLGEVIA